MSRPAFPRFTLDSLSGQRVACCVCGDPASTRATFEADTRRNPEALCSCHARQLELTVDSPHHVKALPDAVDRQAERLDGMLRDYHDRKVRNGRRAGTAACQRALDDIVAALPAPAPAVIVPLGVALARRAETFGAFAG